MELWIIPVVVAVGVASGFLNVVAGGGSLFSMPLMIFLGMPPAVANGTTRIALLAQNVTSVGTFWKRGFSDFRLSLTLGLCSLPGAVAGSFVAVEIDPTWFKRLLAAVMVGVLVLMLRPRRAKEAKEAKEKEEEAPAPPEPEAPQHPAKGQLVAAHLVMVAVGFYGGFIQAGVGFILMAVLQSLLRLDLVRVNMHKVFIVGVYTIASIIVFLGRDKMDWGAGALLAVGHVAGGWLGTHVQITGGEKIIKVIFAVAALATVVGLLIK